jgi:hypothetical protein
MQSSVPKATEAKNVVELVKQRLQIVFEVVKRVLIQLVMSGEEALLS